MGRHHHWIFSQTECDPAEMGGRHRRGPGGPGGGGAGWGPPGGGFPWSFFQRGPRARRGDVRAGILSLLAEQPRNGYQIMQALQEKSRGAWRPSSGSVYPALQQLEDEGLIEAEGGPGSRTFRLTAAGRAYVKEHAEEIAEPWASVSDATGDERLELMHLMKQIGIAGMQVVHAGSPAQIAKAMELLADLRRGLYGILAEDEEDDE